MLNSPLSLLPLLGLLLVPLASANSPAPRAQAHTLSLQAIAHAEALDSLVDQVKDAAVKQALERRLVLLDGTLEALSVLVEDKYISLPPQSAPVPFVPPTVEAQVHLAGPLTHVAIQVETGSEQVASVAKEPMDPNGLTELTDALGQEAFSEGRLRVLRSAVNAPSGFSVDQVLRLLESFDFGGDKVEAAAMLHPQVVDPERWYLVYGAFDFDTDKEALRRQVGE